MNEQWIDGQDVAFSDHRKHLPELASDFPKPKLIRLPDIRMRYLDLLDQNEGFYFWDVRCQICGKELGAWGVRAELHHIVGGARRSDVWTNLIFLCNGSTGCHQMVQHQQSMLRIVLAAKCLTDPEYTDWIAMALLRGSHLPEPEWPASWRAMREGHLRKRGT